jgi:hypothetical protein
MASSTLIYLRLESLLDSLLEIYRNRGHIVFNCGYVKGATTSQCIVSQMFDQKQDKRWEFYLQALCPQVLKYAMYDMSIRCRGLHDWNARKSNR